MAETSASFKPTLGLMDATMIVAGSMIGSGILLLVQTSRGMLAAQAG